MLMDKTAFSENSNNHIILQYEKNSNDCQLLPPCIPIMKHNTVKHRACVRVVLIKVGQHFYLSLKIFSD